jgi:hypothetical protein
MDRKDVEGKGLLCFDQLSHNFPDEAEKKSKKMSQDI